MLYVLCAFPNPCKNGCSWAMVEIKIHLFYCFIRGTRGTAASGEGAAHISIPRETSSHTILEVTRPLPLELIYVALPHNFTFSHGLRPGCGGLRVKTLSAHPEPPSITTSDQYVSQISPIYACIWCQIVSVSKWVSSRVAQHSDHSDRISEAALIRLANVQ